MNDERKEFYGVGFVPFLRWFTATSKEYMNYHTIPFTGKVRFWLQFPRALFQYSRLTIRGFDNVRAIWMLMNWGQ